MNVKMPKLGANSRSFPKLLTILPQNNIATIRLCKFQVGDFVVLITSTINSRKFCFGINFLRFYVGF